MPLGDFAKAYDGPPTDPKAFEDSLVVQRDPQDANRLLFGLDSDLTGFLVNSDTTITFRA